MKREVKIYRFKEPYSVKKHGLFGAEAVVLAGLFTEDRKQTVRYPRLTSPQKKVLRKMKFEKQHFILPKALVQ